MKKLVIYFLISFSFFGCESSEKKKKEHLVKIDDFDSYDVTKKWYYPDGKLRKVQEFDKKGKPTGVYKYYYSSGALQDSAYLLNDKFHGGRFEFHENGELATFTNYWNDSYRNAIDYREDGTLDYYRCYGYRKDVLFLIQYDENGKLKRTDGHPIYQWIGEDSVKIGAKFKQELLVANPPHSKTKFIAYELDQNGNKEKLLIETEPDDFNRIRYGVEHNPNEDKIYLNVVEIYDSTTQKSIVDKLIIRFYKSGRTSFERL